MWIILNIFLFFFVEITQIFPQTFVLFHKSKKLSTIIHTLFIHSAYKKTVTESPTRYIFCVFLLLGVLHFRYLFTKMQSFFGFYIITPSNNTNGLWLYSQPKNRLVSK